MKRALPLRVPGSAQGFTLIEITIAITIASLALVGLLGMVPQGIRTMKMATDLAIEARIHQQVISELTQTDWDNRHNYDKAIRYYDDQGIELPSQENCIYSVRILVPKDGESLPQKFAKSNGQRPSFKPFDNTKLFQVSGNRTNTEFDGVQLVLLEICTTGLAANSNDFDKPANERSIHIYRSTLTRTTKL